MKPPLLLLLAFWGYVLQGDAQTNHFDLLTTLNGVSYSNVEVYAATPAYLDIGHQAGVSRIALTNLPKPLSDVYPYDADKSTQFLAMEAAKKSAAKVAQAARNAANAAHWGALSTNAITISIVGYDPAINVYTAVINGNRQAVVLNSPPADLYSAIQTYAMKTTRAESAYIMAVIQGDNMGKEAEALDYGRAVQDNYLPHVRAFNTGQLSGGYTVWQCLSAN